MEVNITGRLIDSDRLASDLIEFLKGRVAGLGLEEAELYYDYPVLKDIEGVVVKSRILLVSAKHGVIIIDISDARGRDRETLEQELENANSRLDQTYALLYSRLMRNSNLVRSRGQLAFNLDALLFAPFVEDDDVAGLPFAVYDYTQLEDYLIGKQVPSIGDIYGDLIATIDGSKGITRSRKRDVSTLGDNSKGAIANRVEAEINRFDKEQKHGAISVLAGLQRIRGLAGSGKTVVLAMKAAQTHLRYPDATILYTFYTRSLYQHIKRLITRFYRQFDDNDPDWDRVKILHAWGGHLAEGVYYNACLAHGQTPITFSEASMVRGTDPFDFVCTDLLGKVQVKPMFDYVFIDEGQDFPPSFITLCTDLARQQRVVYAYDEFQTIWRTRAPTPAEISPIDKNGKPTVELTDDIVLYKCYRNPREILVSAHAIGLGIYGKRIVQMLQNSAHWEDIGYKVRAGTFEPGSMTEIERPAENSLRTISDACTLDNIVQATAYDSFDDEISSVAKQIKNDISDGLRADDILVEVVDDRNARIYLSNLSKALAKYDIKTNNIHSDPYAITDFYKADHVTLSTVHKAKGNEAFMVYVVGVDALFASWAGPRERNILFTAMTRAKGWVRVSGIEKNAAVCKLEIDKSLAEFPFLRFQYPSQEDLRIMERDLQEKAIRKLEAERALDLALGEMTPEEIMDFVNQRKISKSSSTSSLRRKRRKDE